MAQTAATGQNRVITADSGPEKGRFFRSDHFEFSKLGVPALYLKSGVDYVGKPAGFGKQKTDEYTERDYHKVTDEIKPDWDLSGGVEDVQLLLEVGVLGLVSGMVGTVLASGGFTLLRRVLPLGPWVDRATLDWRLFALTMVVATSEPLIA